MYLAMLTYEYISADQKPNGIPDSWPAKIVELGEESTLPDDLSEDDGWVVIGDTDYAAHIADNQSTYNAWHASYNSASALQAIVKGKILSAKDFGEALLIEIAADNVLGGASQQQVIDLITNNLPLILALKSGSLYTALNMVSNYTPDSLMTQARLDRYELEIRTYLGV